MKKKEKKKSSQQLKQEELHQKNCYLRRIKAMMGIIGDESAYELLSPKGIEVLYFLRLRPVKLISSDDLKLKATKHDLDILNNQLNQLLRENFISLGPEKKQVCLYDFFCFTETLYLILRNNNDDYCLNPEVFKEKLRGFSDDYAEIRVTAFSKLTDCLDFLAWVYSRPIQYNIKIVLEPRKEAKSPFDRSAFYNNYIVSFEKPKTELMEIDGHKRTVFELGAYKENTLIHFFLTPEQLGMTGILQKVPLYVYIQSHAVDRIKERIGDSFICTSYVDIIMAILANKPSRSDDGGFLFPYFYLQKRLGYLKANLIENKIIIRTFLFLTNNGTPEGKKLATMLGVQKEDKKYLGIDKLSTFINSDIEANETLKQIFIKAGCSSLFEMKIHLKQKPDHANQCASYLSHYLGLTRKTEETEQSQFLLTSPATAQLYRVETNSC